MAKGYWITFYCSVSKPDALSEYAKRATPAVQAHGGRFIVRGIPVKVYEKGLSQRTIVIEFDSAERAIACYESREYQAAVKLLEGACERDLRILEGTS